MKNILIFTITFIILTLEASASFITVGEKTITLKEFKRKFNQTKNAINRPTPEQFLEDLIRYEIGIQEARKKNLQKHSFLKDRMNQELYKVLLETELGEEMRNIRVTKREVKAEYKRSPEIRTSHIFFELPSKSTKAQTLFVKKRARSILKKVLRSKKPFEQLAVLYSDDSISKIVGGDLGFQTRLSTNSRYYNVALKLKVGSIHSKLISTPYGFHIVKLTAKNSYKNGDKRHIRSLVFEKKKRKLFDRYFSNLKRNYSIKLDPKAMKKIKSF